MNRAGYSLSRVFVVALITLLFAAIAGAQENAGISGVVTDQSGAASARRYRYGNAWGHRDRSFYIER